MVAHSQICTRPRANTNYPFLTRKERDNETGLDYFLARYYSSTQGRFTSVDPEGAGARESDPRSWNGYAYAGGNPVVFTDPDGREYLLCDADGKNCEKISDEDFYQGRRDSERQGFTFTGDRDFFEDGEVKDANGEVLYTYVQISIDDPVRQFSFAMRNAVDPIPMATAQFFGLSAVIGATGGAAYYVLGPAATVTTLGVGGVKATGYAVRRLRNLSGLTRAQAREALQKEGFKHKGRTPGGYEKWHHPDGSKVQIRPDGEVVRVPSSGAVREAGKGGSGWRVDPNGNLTRSHNTGEKVQ